MRKWCFWTAFSNGIYTAPVKFPKVTSNGAVFTDKALMAPKPIGCVPAKPPGVPDAVDPVAPLAGSSENPKHAYYQ
jgi:hypothetical protein